MTLATIITALIVLVIIGVCLHLVETYVPMAQPFRIVIRVVVVLMLILWLLSVFGLWDSSILRR